MSLSTAELVERLVEAAGLKALPRAGWVRVGVPSPEDVAAHSWGVAWLVMALLPDGMDLGRALSYAVLHDLPEVRAGDITPADGVPPADKARREHDALLGLASGLPARVRATWEAYEAQADAESRFVRELDRLDMAIQALVHHRAGRPGMREFVESARGFITHPLLSPVVNHIAQLAAAGRQ